MSKWFEYFRNNSGGVFVGDYVRVYVEADSPEDADRVAEFCGLVYFDGVVSGVDCRCCGDRWCRAASWDGKTVLEVLGQYVSGGQDFASQLGGGDVWFVDAGGMRWVWMSLWLNMVMC